MAWKILQGDVRKVLEGMDAGSINTCVTSPPYWGLRDYGVAGQLGLEETPEEYVENLVEAFRGVRRVLRDDGTIWVNLGDSYCSTAPDTKGDPIHRRGIFAGVSERRAAASQKQRPKTPSGLKPKDLVGIPWRVAFALQADGWYLRSDIIWSKPSSMPESVTDRPTKAHEYIFLMSKAARYWYDADAIKEKPQPSRLEQDIENQTGTTRGHGGAKANGNLKALGDPVGGRNKRTVWTVTTQPYREAHFATFPPKLIEPCILAGCPEGGTVLDPFSGSGTTGMVALRHNRNYIGIELNPEYVEISKRRIEDDAPLFNR
jgi:DNA modification methylase